jgi:RNA polymerase sigma-32 factor
VNALPIAIDSLDAYMVEVNRFPLLTREEEDTLARRYFDTGDIESAHRLVVSNLRFVVKIALEYRNYAASLKDLIQEGNIGLMTAVKKFNPHKGARLITYAVWWIRFFMQEHIIKYRGMVKRATKELKKELFYRNDGDHRALPADLSLDAPIGDDGTATHLDMLADPMADHAEAFAEKREAALVSASVAPALETLGDKERFIIEARVMSDEPKSLQSIGEMLGITRERVRQIEKTALEKLRKKLVGAS